MSLWIYIFYCIKYFKWRGCFKEMLELRDTAKDMCCSIVTPSHKHSFLYVISLDPIYWLHCWSTYFFIKTDLLTPAEVRVKLLLSNFPLEINDSVMICLSGVTTIRTFSIQRYKSKVVLTKISISSNYTHVKVTKAILWLAFFTLIKYWTISYLAAPTAPIATFQNSLSIRN